jgi:transcriptional regulator with GAF, ATPase, and Fis domain
LGLKLAINTSDVTSLAVQSWQRYEAVMALLLQSTDKGPHQHAVYRQITVIGSSSDSDVVLEDSEVAKEHAHIIREDEHYVIASLGRGRPVFVNGKKQKRCRIRQDDHIRIGASNLTFTLHSAPAHTQQNGKKTPQDPIAKAYREVVAFSEKLLRAKGMDALMPVLMDQVVELTQAEKGFLVTLENGKSVVRVARNIEGGDIDNALTHLSDSIIDKVVREQQPVIVNDALNHVEFKSSVSVMNLQLLSVMCVPLTESGELFGLIYLGSTRVANLFDTSQLEAVTVFAAQASLLLRHAMLLEQLRSDNDTLRGQAQPPRFGTIIGHSPLMQDVFKKVRKVAPTDISVLITGETGTGKELIALELHQLSNRKDQPFIVVNCGAIPENLLESELFGHVRGAFTGAINDKIGHFQAADDGTLFLDEIGELPLQLQVKLLRALQEQVITRVGDTRPQPINIRVLAATNRHLQKEIELGSFREDLYYRLNVVEISLPPLCARGDDIILLAQYFLHRYSTQYNCAVKSISPQATTLMKLYRWPGNIRQLENRIKKGVVMADGVQLCPEDLELDTTALQTVTPLSQAKEQFQRRYIDEILLRNDGNRTKTAEDLGVDPRTIFRHLERTGQDS